MREEQEMERFSVEFEIANQEDLVHANAGEIPASDVRRKTIRGLVDTGATRLVLPESIAMELGLSPAGETNVRYADHRVGTRKMVKHVWLKLLNRESVFNAVLEPNRTEALIGAIVLEDLDFVVDCGTQSLHPRDPDHVISEIE